jgi:hypothetical protein
LPADILFVANRAESDVALMRFDAPAPLRVSADMISIGRTLRVISVNVRNLHCFEWLYVEF